MKVSLTQDKSLFQFLLEQKLYNSQSVSSLSPASFLSLLSSQVDLLIEEEVRATLWVKLPPGKIWRSEIQRYCSWLGNSANIFNYCVGDVASDNKASGSNSLRSKNNITPFEQNGIPFTNIELKREHQLQREYFLIVQSPRWCSLILCHRPRKNLRKQITSKIKINKKHFLLTITNFEQKIIYSALEAIEKDTVKSNSTSTIVDVNSNSTTESTLIAKFFTKQLQRQEEIQCHRINNRLFKLKQQNQKLENNLQLKDDYLSSVCQELRTPLTHMKTALSLLNSQSMKNTQRQRYLQMLSSQCERQNSLIHGVLDLAEIERNLEEMTLEAVHLSDIVPGVVSTYQPIAHEKGIMLAYTVSNELPSVWCVRGGLKQILIHLIANSIRFTSSNGQVWVRGRVHGKYVELEVRDTGVGIPEHEIHKIFERFYRVRSGATEDSTGAGLGLTIVQQLLWRSGGFISVKSKLSEGSTFTVSLPRVFESGRISQTPKSLSK
ncbi:MAG: DICT sensory domain-containing protein [Mastigocoleus sp. MO_167.B18]|nr:DICT sensory domain-containing protein [Mastigocoleus sp. MO_167.B18]